MYQGFLCFTKKGKKGNNKKINTEDILQPLFFSDYFFSELKYFKVKVEQKGKQEKTEGRS